MSSSWWRRFSRSACSSRPRGERLVDLSRASSETVERRGGMLVVDRNLTVREALRAPFAPGPTGCRCRWPPCARTRPWTARWAPGALRAAFAGRAVYGVTLEERELRALDGDLLAVVWEADVTTWQFSFVSRDAQAVSEIRSRSGFRIGGFGGDASPRGPRAGGAGVPRGRYRCPGSLRVSGALPGRIVALAARYSTPRLRRQRRAAEAAGDFAGRHRSEGCGRAPPCRARGYPSAVTLCDMRPHAGSSGAGPGLELGRFVADRPLAGVLRLEDARSRTPLPELWKASRRASRPVRICLARPVGQQGEAGHAALPARPGWTRRASAHHGRPTAARRA